MAAIEKDKYALAEEKAKQSVALVSQDLERRLSPRFETSRRMEHGQISRAARYTMKTLGYEWMLKEWRGQILSLMRAP